MTRLIWLLGAGGQDSSSRKKQVAAPKRKRENWASQPTGTGRKQTTLLFKKGLPELKLCSVAEVPVWLWFFFFFNFDY